MNLPRPAAVRRDEGSASFALVIVGALAVLVVASGVKRARCGDKPTSVDHVDTIPDDYLKLYKKAGSDYGMPWTLLAGIGKVESGHGTSTLPGVHHGENHAGAGGPMQFLRTTWKSFRVDGNNDRRTSRYDPADAIPSAAKYLKHNGAPERTRTAVYMYNHSRDYVDLVLQWADRYGDDNDRAGARRSLCRKSD
ncbi:lytic transglycosylase domain-containing protein [Actinomadura fulvescens]|uniref:Transglycosylase SLT domain-containing protein n=1 Tax=Actinomadura fulvescens TaxID=46160 RepID=A0ABP6D2G5_9ACTN